MHILGVEGMPRRVYTYPRGLGWGYLNQIITVGAFIVAVGILITIVNFFWSKKHGPLAGKNPWYADSLEWSTDSPPAPYGSVHIPTVVSRHPLWDEHEEEDDPKGERILDQGRLTMVTSPLDAQPVAIARIAKDTLKPLLAALSLFVICGALAFRMMWVVWPMLVYMLIVIALWLRPNPETENA
jgi:cytochrome c oxidase subunit 1/cytochrome c oxidase subunit I+III